MADQQKTQIQNEIDEIKAEPEINEVELAKQLGLGIRIAQDGPARKPLLSKKIRLNDELPDDSSTIAFRSTPIDSFGERLLKGMGMGDSTIEGDSLNKRPVKVIQYNPRPEGLGLGAIPKKELLDKIKSGQDIKSKDLRSRMFNNISGVQKDDGSLKYGDLVKVTEGKYDGLEGLVVKIDEEDDRFVTIQLTLNQKNVKVQSKVLEKSVGNKEGIHRQDLEDNKGDNQDEGANGEQKKKKKLKWILPHIDLRVICKKYRGGKYYQEVGYVNDILDERSFTFVMKTGEYFEDLEEKQLETVMPRIGEKVLIVKGEHRGVIGVLKERNKKLNSVVIKIEVNQVEFVPMTQDDCSSYREPN